MMDEHVPYKCMHLDPMREVSRLNFESIQRVESLHDESFVPIGKDYTFT
jgi:hypothetical protein